MKYTVESFTEKLKERWGTNEFTVLKFSDMRSECTIRCEICGKIQTLSRAENFARKTRKCLCDHILEEDKDTRTPAERRKDHFIERIKKQYPDEDLTVLKYTKMDEEAIIQCNKCGMIYKMPGASFFATNKKKVCHNCIPREDTREVGHKVEYLLKNNEDLIVITPYKKITDDLEFQCKKCGGIFKRKPQIFLKSQKCPYCETHSKKRTKEVFQYELNQKYGDEYTIIGDYINTNTPTLFRHNDCGFIFKCKPHDLMSKAPCPKCKKFNSKGEIAIKKILEAHSIEFEQQKRYPNSSIETLSFDFFIPCKNLLIEFQGEQHFMPINHFGGQSKFLKQQENDNKKRNFCKENNIELLEIKYTDINNIENILSFLWLND